MTQEIKFISQFMFEFHHANEANVEPMQYN